ncbi:helix-turn-helix domain-containing protein [Paracoccus sp. PAR01]|uniref:helix-turn-helix domain-containing protein n=1 Tax=Paracoccus sp. PAR01 TaxID=2769282 RepID=UPI00178264FB|nr:helix-turn-helix domain-containing protein [Paracoccus sp. PAR01]MBD9528402.1 helix-turn-helix domain-containing protein [Paracoccus sp. PAR01]
MSHEVITLVSSRIVGSAAAKAVLLNMADKASAGGEGVFCSKATIAAETELSLPTVKREVKALLERGLIRETGETRACANGHTIVYDMNLEAVLALPKWKDGRRIGAVQRDTGITVNPVQGEPGSPRTPTGIRVNPHPVQGEPLTVLEPSLNQPPTPLRGVGAGGVDIHFDEFWSAFPSQIEPDAARKAFAKVLASGEIDGPALVAAAKAYAGSREVGRGYPMKAANWLARGGWRVAVAGQGAEAAAPAVAADRDAVARHWAEAVKAGHSYCASAINATTARRMIALGLVTAAELRKVGVAV